MTEILTNIWNGMATIIAVMVLSALIFNSIKRIIKNHKEKNKLTKEKEDLEYNIRLNNLKCPICPSDLLVSHVSKGVVLLCGKCGFTYADHTLPKQLAWAEKLAKLIEGDNRI